ncbi:AzlD family protein [Labrys okinawensis]|uniref:AzlD family protein n=1 Tax=Labrys okinawensis TaxID=346911 RepID=UPI0039BD2243
MSLNLNVAAAILVMALVTYGTRIAGIFLSGRLKLAGRPKAAFDAIPAAVLVSVIAPVALATGPAETTATVIAGISATRLPLLVTIVIGVVSVVLLRMAMP